MVGVLLVHVTAEGPILDLFTTRYARGADLPSITGRTAPAIGSEPPTASPTSSSAASYTTSRDLTPVPNHEPLGRCGPQPQQQQPADDQQHADRTVIDSLQNGTRRDHPERK